MSISKFIIQFSIFAGIVFLFPYAVELFFKIPIISPHFTLLFVFLLFLFIGVYVISYLGIKKGGQSSVLGILGGLTIKMILSLIAIVILIFKSSENQKLLVGNFFYLYFLFTLFEVICLLRNLRDQNKT